MFKECKFLGVVIAFNLKLGVAHGFKQESAYLLEL